MVAIFLHVLAHDVKNREIQRDFVPYGETVSRHFDVVLMIVLCLLESYWRNDNLFQVIAQIPSGGVSRLGVMNSVSLYILTLYSLG